MRSVMTCAAMLIVVSILGSLVLGAGLQVATLVQAPPVVCVARDQQSWRDAVRLSWSRDVIIDLHTTVGWSGTFWDFRLGRAGGAVEIRGGTIDLSGYASAWPSSYDPSGLVLTARRATLRGVTVRGYEGTGCALRADVSDTLEVVDGHFADIGTRTLPLRPDGTPGYTNTIGAFNLQARRIAIVGNRFSRCSLNDEQLAHVLYLSARQSILATGNRYDRCGSIWGCYSPGTVVTGEYADAGADPLVWDRRLQTYVHPWALVHNGGRLVFAGNTLTGTWDHVFHGHLPAGSVIGGNRYDIESRYWFFQWSVPAPQRDRSWWVAQGFDRS